MTDDPMAPAFDGPNVTFNGRTMLRVRGGDGTEEAGNQEAATQDAPDAPAKESASDGQAEKPDYFDEKFDPATLPDELRPAYHQMRNAFTGKTQTIAQERQELRQAKEAYDALQDPQQRAALLAQFGVDLDQDDDLDLDEPDGDLRQEWEAFKAEREQQQQSEQQAQYEQARTAYINRGLAELTEKVGKEFSEDEYHAIGVVAESLTDADGAPDVQAAYDLIYTKVLPAERERWKQSKDTVLAPDGVKPAEDLDLDNPEERQAWMDAKYAQKAAGE